MRLDPSQEAAVALMCSARFAVVTGGPGCGKTTSLRVALDRLDMRGESYALCAPTGKAAKRMCEATGRPASTIHRLLAWGFGSPWGQNKDNPLSVDAVFVDESSMLDVELACALMAAAPYSRVIFIGDSAQLPSVGPGRILADLVESGAVPVARLTTVHRSAQESWVCAMAPRVLTGEELDLETRQDFYFIEVENGDDIPRQLTRLMYGDAKLGILDVTSLAQVLVPQRTTSCGVEAINTALQAAINPRKGDSYELNLGPFVLRAGDRVIQTSNNYKLDGGRGVFNGEVGTVTHVSSQGCMVDFDGKAVEYSRADAVGLDLAYALTVHKSQGSEFPWVVCVVHSAHTYMLTRQLFYTAITRAKKGVVIVGNRKGLHAALSGKEPPKRNTGLVARMAELMGTGTMETKEESAAEPAAEGDTLSW